MVDVGVMASQGMDTISFISKLVIYVGLVLVPVLYIWHVKRHKHYVEVRIVTDKGNLIFQDKAREIMVDGVKFWKLMKRKDTISVPPPKALSTNTKGKLSTVAYYSEEHGYIWANDTVNKSSFEQTYEEETLQNGKTVKVIRKMYEPFSTQERSQYAQQIRKAAERKGTSLLDRIIQLLPFIMVFMMFVLVLLFWEDIAKPVSQISSENVEISKSNAIISEQNAKVLVLLGYKNVSINQNIQGERLVIPADAME